MALFLPLMGPQLSPSSSAVLINESSSFCCISIFLHLLATCVRSCIRSCVELVSEEEGRRDDGRRIYHHHHRAEHGTHLCVFWRNAVMQWGRALLFAACLPSFLLVFFYSLKNFLKTRGEAQDVKLRGEKRSGSWLSFLPSVHTSIPPPVPAAYVSTGRALAKFVLESPLCVRTQPDAPSLNSILAEQSRHSL